MFPHGHPLLTILPLVTSFAIANRLWGAGDKGGKLHLKAIATALVFAVTLAIHWPLVVFAVGWFLWRFVALKVLGGSLAPTPGQIAPTFLHHFLLSAPAFFGGAAAFHAAHIPGELLFAPVAMLAFAVLATFDARENALQAARGRNINWLCELTTGGGYGLLAGILAVIP